MGAAAGCGPASPPVAPSAAPSEAGALEHRPADARPAGGSEADARPTDPRAPLRIAAASSLSEAFTELGAAFAAAEGRPLPTFDFDASSSLAARIKDGAPVDVFASADDASLQRVAEAGGLAGEARLLAHNSLALVVPKDNPAGVAGLADLEREGLLLATCDPQVPIGRYSQALFAAAGIAPRPSSLEANVKGIVTKVALGEVDAGIVYATDALAAGDRLQVIPLPQGLGPRVSYPIAVLKAAADPAEAERFLAFALGPDGQAILRRAGFAAP